jgi:hypothetical protein
MAACAGPAFRSGIWRRQPGRLAFVARYPLLLPPECRASPSIWPSQQRQRLRSSAPHVARGGGEGTAKLQRDGCTCIAAPSIFASCRGVR